MRKSLLPVAGVALLALAGTAFGAEFQPFGAVGIGGAGVARTTNAYAGHWNPAGLAFNEMTFSMKIGASAGLRVSKGLADNVDRLSEFTEEGADGLSTIDRLETLDGSDPAAVADMVSLLNVIGDIEEQKGTLSLSANAVVALQYKHLAFGAFGTMEGFAQPLPDLVRILPTTTGGTSIATPADFFTTLGTPVSEAGYQPRFFTDQQLQDIASVFTDPTLTNGAVTADQATAMAQALDQQFDTNRPQASAGDIAGTITTTLSSQLRASNDPVAAAANTIDDNRTAVMVKSLAYIEFPLSYGHPIDLGAFGKLGIGGSLKAIRGRVYQSRVELIEGDENVESDDILDNFTKNFEETNAITVDLGALWKYNNWVSVGVVAKNLTSPSFDSPQLKNQNGEFVDEGGNIVAIPIQDDKVKLKPQVRLGVAFDPLSWLTIAADLDLTENETVLSGLGFKSRHFGGGIELHPYTWFKVRGGAYTNLANSEIGPVATAGLTLGTKWVNLDLDGAYGLESARFEGKKYPKEARADLNLNVQF